MSNELAMSKKWRNVMLKVAPSGEKGARVVPSDFDEAMKGLYDEPVLFPTIPVISCCNWQASAVADKVISVNITLPKNRSTTTRGSTDKARSTRARE